ncbi:hypothetical protein [Nocardia sp. X0981]
MDWGALKSFTLEVGAGALIQAIPIGKGANALAVRSGVSGAIVGAGAEGFRGNSSPEGLFTGALFGAGGGLLGHFAGRSGIGRLTGKTSDRYAKTMGSLNNRVGRHQRRVTDARNDRDAAQTTVNNLQSGLGRGKNFASLGYVGRQAKAKLTAAEGQLKKVEGQLAKAQSLQKKIKKPADRWKKTTDSFKSGWGNHTLVGLGNAAFRQGYRSGSTSDSKGGGGEKKKEPPTASESLTWDGAAAARAQGLM